MTIQITNELVDLFFRESGRMGVRGAIEALLEKVNEEIERDYVPRDKLACTCDWIETTPHPSAPREYVRGMRDPQCLVHSEKW